MGANIDFSVQGFNLVTPENHSHQTQVPRRTLDPRDQSPKAGQPIGDPEMDLSHGNLSSDFPTFHFDITPDPNFLSFQDQGVLRKGPQGETLGHRRMNPPQGIPYMAWDSGASI